MAACREKMDKMEKLTIAQVLKMSSADKEQYHQDVQDSRDCDDIFFENKDSERFTHDLIGAFMETGRGKQWKLAMETCKLYWDKLEIAQFDYEKQSVIEV